MRDHESMEAAAKQSDRLSCVESRNGAAIQSTATRQPIAATERLIRPHIRRTPVTAGDFALDIAPLIFKLELLRHSGSYYEVQDLRTRAPLAQANLHTLIGDRTLDETLVARDMINTNLRSSR
jgi:hypothetical protein